MKEKFKERRFLELKYMEINLFKVQIFSCQMNVTRSYGVIIVLVIMSLGAEGIN